VVWGGGVGREGRGRRAVEGAGAAAPALLLEYVLGMAVQPHSARQGVAEVPPIVVVVYIVIHRPT
jgi:hypothetical protein